MTMSTVESLSTSKRHCGYCSFSLKRSPPRILGYSIRKPPSPEKCCVFLSRRKTIGFPFARSCSVSITKLRRKRNLQWENLSAGYQVLSLRFLHTVIIAQTILPCRINVHTRISIEAPITRQIGDLVIISCAVEGQIVRFVPPAAHQKWWNAKAFRLLNGTRSGENRGGTDVGCIG